MKQFSIIIALFLILSGSLCFAQTSQPTITDDFKPSSLNQPGKEYPQVNSQGYVRFRIEAPQAQSVVVSLGLGGTKGGTPLAKSEDGSWTGTTAGPMEEGFHYYHLTIDGGVFNDPGALNFYGSTRWESGIEIPAHNQGVTGSSPVGPTPLTASLPEDGGLSYFQHQYNMCTTNSRFHFISLT